MPKKKKGGVHQVHTLYYRPLNMYPVQGASELVSSYLSCTYVVHKP